MKKLGNSCRKLVIACICMIAGVSAYAQEVVPTYDMQVSKQPEYWYDGPIPIIAFGVLFVIGAYLIYHFWANGKLKDDIS